MKKMKTRPLLIIIAIGVVSAIAGVFLFSQIQAENFKYPQPNTFSDFQGNDTGEVGIGNQFMPDMFGKIDLSKINLPPTEYGQIDYTKIGHLVSESKFKRMLDERNIRYDPDNFILIDGMEAESYPPISGYCGYVLDTKNEDYWFSSTFRKDTISDYKIFEQNPDPCRPGYMSCFCSLQTSLAEKNLEDLSYFDESEDAGVGKILQDYLNEENRIENVPASFVVGKYNLEIEPNITSFCGQFKGNHNEWYFHGSINGTNVADFFLDLDKKPNLCAIKENSPSYHFQIMQEGQ
ncbi:MAG TPA: hypothetical protein VNK07_00265 [Candidatus Binatia bacterium]|nr:hypothetical protein [Candidatus Binatia bacterium]